MVLSVTLFGQKKYFEKALKNGRTSGNFYFVVLDSDKAVKDEDVIEFANKNNYLLRNITHQMVNRFGDKFNGVKSFSFLPISEIPQVIFETKFNTNIPYKEIAAKGKSKVYFWMGGNSLFNLYSGFYWSGNVTSEGFADGDGLGFYFSDLDKISAFFTGRFNKGVLQGNGTFATYSYSDISNFDKASVVTNSIHLNSNFYDDMAVLTVGGKKGFVGKDMKTGFYPKYKSVVQEFSNGKAIVLNDDNKEIVINKTGNFIAYSDRQIQIDEQRRKEEEERRRIAIENEKNRIHEAYNLAINSNDETQLLQFYSQHKSSSYDFAKDYANTAYNKAIKLNEKNYQPFIDELNYNQGNSLVKMIFTTNDGSPIALKVDYIYNFLDGEYSGQGISTGLIGEILTGKSEKILLTKDDKLFPSIRKPIAYIDNAIVNAFWYRAGTESKGGSWSTSQNTGFKSFIKNVQDFAKDLNMTVKVSYLGTLDDDIAREQERMASLQRYREENCEKCIINPKKSTTPSVTDHWYWGKVKENGVIKMLNDDKYEWYLSEKGFTIVGVLFSKDESYKSWELMKEELLQRCRKKYSCQ